jgi:hypothetical protein
MLRCSRHGVPLKLLPRARSTVSLRYPVPQGLEHQRPKRRERFGTGSPATYTSATSKPVRDVIVLSRCQIAHLMRIRVPCPMGFCQMSVTHCLFHDDQEEISLSSATHHFRSLLEVWLVFPTCSTAWYRDGKTADPPNQNFSVCN